MKNNKRYLIIILLAVLALAVSVGAWTMHQNATLRTSDLDSNVTQHETNTKKREAKPLETLLFASDYQIQKGWKAPKKNLKRLLRAVKIDGKTPDMVVYCGDYTNDPHLYNYDMNPDESIQEIRETVSSSFKNISDDEMLFVQGNHDKLTDSISRSGLYECDDYFIYLLNTQNDFPWKQGEDPENLDKVKASSKKLKKCLNKLIKNEETRPVFIISHVPMHFTGRTTSRHGTGDTVYSSLLFDVVNEAAKSLDIVYLYGHNHSKGWDCYMGGSSVFRSVGDILLVPEFEGVTNHTNNFSAETLNFTYLNAGYTGYFMNCGVTELREGRISEYAAADQTLTCTVCEIMPDRLILSRYDKSGVHCLGHEGEENPYEEAMDRYLISEEYYGKKVSSPQVIVRKSVR